MIDASRRVHLIGRFLSVAVVLSAAAVLVSAQPALGQPTFTNAPRLSWVYTDSREAHTSFPSTPTHIPVGAWRDAEDKHHISRTYLTYDLSPYAGKTIVSTSLFLRDDKTTDCGVRSLQVWETEVPVEPATWADPPAELTLLGTFGPSACPGVAGIDIGAHIRAAIGAGQERIGIEIRVPDTEPGEGDLALGRLLSRFSGPRLLVGFNSPPSVATEHLYNDGRACDTQAPYNFLGGTTVQLGAMLNDPDDNTISLAGEFAIWPIDNPDQRTVLTRTNAIRGFVNNVTVPEGALTTGVTYGWAVRVTDGIDTSPWSHTCIFTFDSVRPSAGPGVVSENYAQGQLNTGGRAPTFTFSPNGVDDVAAYQYSFDVLSVIGFSTGPFGIPNWTDPFDTSQFVRADSVGGSATVNIPFTRDGFLKLSVRSFDRAYNSGPIQTYEFFVRATDPRITVVDPPVRPGRPFTVTFDKHPDVVDVLDYTYRVDNTAPQTVAAGPDGSAAVSVTLPSYGLHSVTVRSRSANGWVSSEGRWFSFLTNTPSVTSSTYPEFEIGGGVGVEGEFTFHPGSFGAVSYVYSFNFGPEITVAAGPDGTATVSFTPDTPGFNQLEVRAIDVAGISSASEIYSFEVADLAKPSVTSATYPEWGLGGGVGVEGTFTIHPGNVPAAAFAYSFNWNPESTIEAGADGTATVSFTPEFPGFNELIVYALDANGIAISGAYSYVFFVAEDS